MLIKKLSLYKKIALFTIAINVIFTFIAYAFYNVDGRITTCFNYILLFILLINIFFILNSYNHKKLTTKDKLIGLFLLFSLITISINPNRIDSLKIFVFTCSQLLIIFKCDVSDKDNIELILKGFNIIAFLISFIGIVLYFKNINITLYTGRHCGIYSNPNIGGIISCISMMISFAILFRKEKKIAKIYHILNILVQSIEMILCGSRATFVVFFIFILIFSYLILNKTETKKYMCLLFTALIFAGSIGYFSAMQTMVPYTKGLINLSSERITSSKESNIPNSTDSSLNTSHKEIESDIGRDNTDESTTGRIQFILNGIKTGLKKPILGVGTSNLSSSLIQNIGVDYSAMEVGGSHNIYVDLFVSNGIIGLILFIMIIGYIIIYSLKMMYKINDNIMYTGLFSIFISLIAYGMFESNLIISGSIVASIFWLIGGYLTYESN